MSINKKYLMVIICWLCAVIVPVTLYIFINSEWFRFIMFLCFLLYTSGKFEEWISDEE